MEITDREMRALRVLMEEKFVASNRATIIANDALMVRFESVNEWRKQLDRERQEFASVHEIRAIRETIQRLDMFQSKVLGALILVGFMASAGVVALIGMLR
jgi:hypothetical protein